MVTYLEHNYKTSSFKVIDYITSMLDECSIYHKDFSILDLVMPSYIITGCNNVPTEKLKLLKMKRDLFINYLFLNNNFFISLEIETSRELLSNYCNKAAISAYKPLIRNV